MPRSPHDGEHRAWRWVGWFSLALALAGVGDWVLAWMPPHLGNPEWEFGTVAATMAGLPLMAMGFAGLLATGTARHQRWLVVTMTWVLIGFALVVLAALALFLLDVPLALRTVQGTARVGIIKATIKTSFLGLLFATAFGIAGLTAMREAARIRGTARD